MGKEHLLAWIDSNHSKIEVKAPKTEKNVILNYIESSMMQKMAAIRFWKTVSASFMTATLILTAMLGLHFSKPHNNKMMVVYPAQSQDNSVHVLAHYKNKDLESKSKPVRMELAHDGTLWQAEIHHASDVVDCEFLVDSETAPETIEE